MQLHGAVMSGLVGHKRSEHHLKNILTARRCLVVLDNSAFCICDRENDEILAMGSDLNNCIAAWYARAARRVLNKALT